VNAEDIKALRKELNLTQRAVAEALDIDVALVRDWEASEQFATKSHCEQLAALRTNPPKPKSKKTRSPMQVLQDPAFWTLHRKLLAHPSLLAACEKLALEYDDPALPVASTSAGAKTEL
jgi:transcriptional regulator with XRE-family HTH domain